MDAPPGWYPDPAGSGCQRWWDGTQWGVLQPLVTPTKESRWLSLAWVALAVGIAAAILAAFPQFRP